MFVVLGGWKVVQLTGRVNNNTANLKKTSDFILFLLLSELIFSYNNFFYILKFTNKVFKKWARIGYDLRKIT